MAHTTNFIGLVGEKGSGKGTFFMTLKAISLESIGNITFSAIISKTLKDWYLPTERHNLQKLVRVMRDTFGEGVLSNAIKQDALTLAKTRNAVILDGLRWWSDYEILQSLKPSTLIYITADPETRWKRTVLRKQKAGEGETTFEQFLAEEQVETETYIPEIGKKADHTIINNGSLEAFEKQVEEVYFKILFGQTTNSTSQGESICVTQS